MRAEILYPETANLLGERGDIQYIPCIFPEAEIIYTDFPERPRFIDADVDLAVMGPVSESVQSKIIKLWSDYTEKIIEKINSGMHFLMMGNAGEVFSSYIEDSGERRENALGILPFFVKRDLKRRLNSLFLGKRKDYEIAGVKSQFTEWFVENEKTAGEADLEEPGLAYLCDEVLRGFGLNKSLKKEGLIYKNFIATSVLGPFLVCNPPFVKEWKKSICGSAGDIRFFDTSAEAYIRRIKQLHDPGVKLH